jgi:hypothetical protein
MLTAPQVLLSLSLNMIYQGGLGQEICYYGYFNNMYSFCFSQCTVGEMTVFAPD